MQNEIAPKAPVYLHENGVYFPGFNSTADLIEFLPAGVYKLSMVERGPMKVVPALSKIKNRFTMPEKFYGAESEEIYRTLVEDFKGNKRGTTAMIYGDKGCGKSVIAERCANYCIDAGLPVIYYEEAVDFAVLKGVLPFIGQCAVICEEFLKHNADYDKDGGVTERQQGQNPMLTLLSDKDMPKMFMILLDNSKAGVSKFMINRPDRIRWVIEHEINRVEIFDEMVKDEPIMPELKAYLRVYFASFNGESGGYDVMKMIIEKARNVMTTSEFIKKMKHWNVPPVRNVKVELCLDEIWNERRNDSELANSVITCKVEKNVKDKFPVISLANKPDLEFFDADQIAEHIDFNKLITKEWLDDALASVSSGSAKIDYKDLTFVCSINTNGSDEPTHELGGYPFVFSFVPPNNVKTKEEGGEK